MNKKNLLNKNGVYIFILLIISIFVFKNIFHEGYLIDYSHFYVEQKLIGKNILNSVFEHKSMYYWDTYVYGGVPLFAHPETYFIIPNLLFLLITRNLYFSLTATLVLHFFLMGLGMYLLVLRFTKSKLGAFLSAIIYMFNSYSFNFGIYGNLSVLIPLSLAPFVFLFADRAIGGKKTLVFAAITSILLAMMLHAGGVILFMYIVLMIGLYYLFSIFTSKHIIKDIPRKSGILVLILILTILLSAVKAIPAFEFSEKSSRQDVSYETFLEGKIETSKLINNLVFNFRNPKQGEARIGIVSWLLILFCIPLLKKKKVLFFSLIIILSILIATGSFLTHIMYKVLPFYSQLKHPERVLILFVFSGAVLSGFGYQQATRWLQKKGKIKHLFFPLIILLLAFEFTIIDTPPKAMEFKNVPALEYISQDQELLRLHLLRTGYTPFENIIGSFGQGWAIDYDIPMIIGTGTVWLQDYVKATLLAETYKSAKLWGILNVKYFLAEKEILINNITFVRKFEECNECKPKIIGGPYLYENELFLPRAYLVDNAILIVGSNIEDATYSTIFHSDFNPSKTVIIMKEGDINDLNIKYLKRFKVLLLTSGSINEKTNLVTLREYVDSGGIVLPNILENKQSISNEEINTILTRLNGYQLDIKKINISHYSPNKVELNLNEKKGFLVLSEKYYLFPNDWTAKINGKEKEILRANGVISAVYLEEEKGEIVFEYKPRSFIIGSWISLVTLLLIISYFAWFFYRKKKKI